jgi:hypothetical protein
MRRKFRNLNHFLDVCISQIGRFEGRIGISVQEKRLGSGDVDLFITYLFSMVKNRTSEMHTTGRVIPKSDVPNLKMEMALIKRDILNEMKIRLSEKGCETKRDIDGIRFRHLEMAKEKAYK